nr:hypothetical protein [uncultured Dongia sp.]
MEQNSNKIQNERLPALRLRPCLGCGQWFLAEGPFLRICSLCKESEEWQSGDCDVVLHQGRAANDN